MLEIPDIFLGWRVDAEPEPMYEEKLRVPPLGPQVAEPTDMTGHNKRASDPKSKSSEILPQPCMPAAPQIK